jgi:transglutaminase-like putative cysteine protease
MRPVRTSSRRWLMAVSVVALCFGAAGCRRELRDDAAMYAPPPHVVTADIQAGIESYIEERTRAGGGYFRFSSAGVDYSLKLVRVHTEYLANLGPRWHFACVDLVDTAGDVHDVDFFLSGDPGAMKVTETTLHKRNGQPHYVWKQKRDGTWYRLPTKDVPEDLLGVITGRDEFEFLYRVELPKISGTARLWMPLASTDAFQTIDVKSIDAPVKHRILKDPVYGNRVLFMEIGPKGSGKRIQVRYHVKRIEKAAYAAEEPDPAKYLLAQSMVPFSPTMRALAEKAVAGKKTDLVRARALYDHVIDRMRYAKHGTGWGKGDAVYACNAGNGNCTDFHSYFIALARSVNIPARFAIGAAIPSQRNDGGVDGYHCWVEFYADGKWWPIDISEADKYTSLSTYYFGHHPANRLEFSRGRDLQVEPGPASGPMNFLAYPVLEIDGKVVKAKIQFSFTRRARGK